MKKVSIDFDGTLSKKEVQDYVLSLKKRGYELFIVTARYNELLKHLYTTKPCNKIVFETAKKLGIPIENIIFTNMHSKCNVLLNSNVLFHLDDDILTIEELNKSGIKCIDVTKKNWKIIANIIK